jgi:hypothetical protein
MATGRQYGRLTSQSNTCGIHSLQLTLVPSHLPPVASDRELVGAPASLGGLGALKLVDLHHRCILKRRGTVAGWAVLGLEDFQA